MLRDIIPTRNEKGRAPYSCAHHPMEEVVTQHGGGAPGEKPLKPVGVHLRQNFSGMNESRESRSNIRTVLFRSTPCHTTSRPKIHNRRNSRLGPATAPLRICRTIFDCAERCHTQFGFPSLQRRLPLKNFKPESTAFRVAQIFRFSCQKYRRTLPLDAQVTEPKQRHITCFEGLVGLRRALPK